MAKKSTCKNISQDANLPIAQGPSKYRISYEQVRCSMKRLNNALPRDGRPCKFCKRCRVELFTAKPYRRKTRNDHVKPEEPARRKQRMATTGKNSPTESIETSQ